MSDVPPPAKTVSKATTNGSTYTKGKSKPPPKVVELLDSSDEDVVVSPAPVSKAPSPAPPAASKASTPVAPPKAPAAQLDIPMPPAAPVKAKEVVPEPVPKAAPIPVQKTETLPEDDDAAKKREALAMAVDALPSLRSLFQAAFDKASVSSDMETDTGAELRKAAMELREDQLTRYSLM